MRKQRTLEEQLIIAEENLKQAQIKAKECDDKISDIKLQIENRDMKEAYQIMKQNNISVSGLKQLLCKQSEDSSKKKPA